MMMMMALEKKCVGITTDTIGNYFVTTEVINQEI